MKIWILAHFGDDTAQRVYAAFRSRRKSDQVRLITSEELVLAPHWRHKLSQGTITSQVQLADGTWIIPDPGDLIFNRLQAVKMPQFEIASREDQNFAAQEMYALWLSWLSSLPCAVVNSASPRGLSGQNRSPVEWLMLAARAGLPVRGYAFTSDPRHFPTRYGNPSRRLAGLDNRRMASYETITRPIVSRQPLIDLEPISKDQEVVLLAGDRTVGKLTEPFGVPLRRLGELAGCDLLQATFARVGSPKPYPNDTPDWRILGVTAFPVVHDLAGINAIVEALEDKLEAQKVMV